MADYRLDNNKVYTFTIGTKMDATGAPTVPLTGNTFAAVSSDPAAVNVFIGRDANANPAVIANAMVRSASGVTLTVNDTAGSKVCEFVVDVGDEIPPASDLTLDTVNVTHEAQPVPEA